MPFWTTPFQRFFFTSQLSSFSFAVVATAGKDIAAPFLSSRVRRSAVPPLSLLAHSGSHLSSSHPPTTAVDFYQKPALDDTPSISPIPEKRGVETGSSIADRRSELYATLSPRKLNVNGQHGTPPRPSRLVRPASVIDDFRFQHVIAT